MKQTKRRFYVFSSSDPAPFVGDTEEKHITGISPRLALDTYIQKYDHPSGLHWAAVWKSADDRLAGKKALATFKHKCRFT